MKALVKLIIESQGIRTTPAIYISILIAYLDELKWNDAQYIIDIMESLEMKLEEQCAYSYIKEIVKHKNLMELADLWYYLF